MRWWYIVTVVLNIECRKPGQHQHTRERERERERVHLSSHTGLMQVLPGHPLADTITECSITVWNNNIETRIGITSKERGLGAGWWVPGYWRAPRGGTPGSGV